MNAKTARVLALLALAGGCSDPSGPEPAADVLVTLVAELTAGDTARATVVALTGSGDAIPDANVLWSSTNPAVASVDQTGLVTALSAGAAQIRAQVDGVAGGAPLLVYSQVASVSLDRDTVTIDAGDAVVLVATVLDPEGEPAVRPLFWSADDTLVAKVFSDGRVIGRTAGVTDVRVAVGGLEASTRVRVHATDPAYVEIDAGRTHTCGRTPGGLALCWGSDGSGQLGRGVGSGSSAVPVSVGTYERLVSISVGGAHACALGAQGAALCWGADDRGQLGADAAETCDAAAGCARKPVPVAGALAFDMISAGPDLTCGTAQAVAYCWGANDRGQVGAPATALCQGVACNPLPTAVSGGHAFESVAAGALHACALTPAGQAWCWGEGEMGNLGYGFVTAQSMPVQVATTATFAALTAGSWHTCARESTGGTWCWGLDSTGQLGVNTGSGACTFDDWTWDCEKTPARVSISLTVLGIDAAPSASVERAHACAFTAGGAAYCWGSDVEGELGSNSLNETCIPRLVTYVCSRTPLQVALSGNARGITAGGAHACAITDQNEVWCWGRGAEGQLGNGQLVQANTPVRVGA